MLLSTKTNQSNMSDTELTTIGIQVPENLKADVKIKCAREGKTIRQVVEELLKEWVKK